MTLDRINCEVAKLLLRSGAISVTRSHPFILAGGWASPVYVDVRLLIGDPEWRATIVDLTCSYLAAAAGQVSFDIVAGAESAGIPYATMLAEAMQKPLCYVRKRPLGIGKNAQVEGANVEGMKVLLVDDMTTDGSSKISFIRGLSAAGASVDDILTIFFFDVFPGVQEKFQDRRVRFHALATWADVLRYAPTESLAHEDRQELHRFLADPVSWSGWHGGRSNAKPETTALSTGSKNHDQ